MQAIKPIKTLRIRNRVAIAAWVKTGAGPHRDKKKHGRKRACRSKVNIDD